MPQHIQEVAQRADRAATLAVTAALARRQVLLQRRHQEAVATARAVCHRSQLLLARQRVRRQRRQGQRVGPLAWFAVQGEIDQRSSGRSGPMGSSPVTGSWMFEPGCWSTWASSSAATILHAGTTLASRPRRSRCC
jgi:hypothetical protein